MYPRHCVHYLKKWHGLTDNEQIYRQRYLDLIVNEDFRDRFQARSRIIREIVNFSGVEIFWKSRLQCFNRFQVEQQPRPFRTHFNALDCDFSIRIALELHLKRLLVGGFDRVFEVGRGSLGMKDFQGVIIQSLPCSKHIKHTRIIEE